METFWPGPLIKQCLIEILEYFIFADVFFWNNHNMGRDVSGCLMKRSPGKQKKCHFEVGKKGKLINVAAMSIINYNSTL